MIIRTLCDIYDGLIARKCNKTTKIGKNLDILSDTLLALIILTIAFFKINNKFIYLKFLILILISIFIYGGYKNIVTDNYDLIGNNTVFQILHDNTIISVPLAVLATYYLKNNFN
jgi:phosphatidylserine synthase